MRNRRNTRKRNVVISTITNRNFIIIVSVLLVLILISFGIIKIRNYQDEQLMARQAEELEKQTGEIFSDMENNLRKHVLSNYASINRTNISTGPTAVTENIENSDVDEFVMSGPTHITRSIEESDSDGFVLGVPTGLTHSIEESDPDEMFMEPTKNTFTVETSDEDEFLLM